MSNNDYLDTYFGQVIDFDAEGNPFTVEMILVRAVDFNHARMQVHENLDERDGHCHVEVKRWRHPRLVASPSDQWRAAKRAKRNGVKAPQYGS